MAHVLLQAGHSSAFPPMAGYGGGAPGEADWTGRFCTTLQVHLAPYVDSTILGSWLSNGVLATPPSEAGLKYDLAIFCHYDANIYGMGGGFADRYRPEKWGKVTSQQTINAEICNQFIREWESTYPRDTGIPNVPSRRNANTWNYYAYRAMHRETPAVIIEFGVGAPGAPDWDTLWNKMPDVAFVMSTLIRSHLAGRNLLDTQDVRPSPIYFEQDLFPTPIPTEEEALVALGSFGFTLPHGFGITNLAVRAYRRGEWRGPAISDEYLHTMPDGREVVRRDFTAGTAEYDPASGTTTWAEVIKEAREGW